MSKANFGSKIGGNDFSQKDLVETAGCVPPWASDGMTASAQPPCWGRSTFVMIVPACPSATALAGFARTTRMWDRDKGCECGAGMPCECQRANGLEQPDISKVLDEH